VELKENVTINEGVDAYGNAHTLILEGDQLVKKTTFDAEPLLEEAKAQRNHTAGERWGDMRRVATLPMAVYAKFASIQDNRERQRQVRLWIQQNPAFCTFDRYLK
jgi:hypothetical protein